MKKLSYIVLALLTLMSCKQEPKDYVTFSGKITNPNSDSIIVISRADRSFKKLIKVNKDGSFSDTLKIANGIHSFFDGSEAATLYLKNGFDISVTLDTKQFDETIVYTGEGSEANNYLAQKSLSQEKMFNDDAMFVLEKEKFTERMASIENDFMKALEETKGLDASFVEAEKSDFMNLKGYLFKFNEEKYFLHTVLGKGKSSPKFISYENNAGGSMSLDDLKGKYVYIDVWATWCGPCKYEIPYLKQVEKDYHDKDIQFVSISIDKKKDYDKWKTMIKDKELGGIQLLADNDWKSEFILNYKINGIPRFILVDPKGNIVTADAPRPSNKKLRDLFDSLDI